MSEMVWEFAGDFIRMGDTLDERQSPLNAACSVWNIACNPPEVRENNLDNYVREYLRHRGTRRPRFGNCLVYSLRRPHAELLLK